MLCSVAEHAGSGRARKKCRGKSSVFPHFLSALRLPKCSDKAPPAGSWQCPLQLVKLILKKYILKNLHVEVVNHLWPPSLAVKGLGDILNHLWSRLARNVSHLSPSSRAKMQYKKASLKHSFDTSRILKTFNSVKFKLVFMFVEFKQMTTEVEITIEQQWACHEWIVNSTHFKVSFALNRTLKHFSVILSN